MKRLITYSKAIEELDDLKNYVSLIENFKINSLEDEIIYKYALYNSISKVISHINTDLEKNNFISDLSVITPDFIKKIILNKPSSELHFIIRKGYLLKTRPQRRKKTL